MVQRVYHDVGHLTAPSCVLYVSVVVEHKVQVEQIAAGPEQL